MAENIVVMVIVAASIVYLAVITAKKSKRLFGSSSGSYHCQKCGKKK